MHRLPFSTRTPAAPGRRPTSRAEPCAPPSRCISSTMNSGTSCTALRCFQRRDSMSQCSGVAMMMLPCGGGQAAPRGARSVHRTAPAGDENKDSARQKRGGVWPGHSALRGRLHLLLSSPPPHPGPPPSRAASGRPAPRPSAAPRSAPGRRRQSAWTSRQAAPWPAPRAAQCTRRCRQGSGQGRHTPVMVVPTQQDATWRHRQLPAGSAA